MVFPGALGRIAAVASHRPAVPRPAGAQARLARHPRRCCNAFPLPARGVAVLPLGGQGRVAQRTVVRTGGGLAIANAHLEHRSHASALRLQQVRRIAQWLEPCGEPQVICGDLNDVPDSPALAALGGYRTAHGPDFAVTGTSPAWNPHRVIDYVLVVERVQVLEAGLCLDRPVNGTWPSDHIGLWAKLSF